MPDANGEPTPDTGKPDFARVNLRDHPSTALVLLAIMGSALAWTLHKWLGRRSDDRAQPPEATNATEASMRQDKPAPVRPDGSE